jgi:integrase
LAAEAWIKHYQKKKDIRGARQQHDVIVRVIGKKAVADVSRADAQAVHDAVAKTGPVQAARTIARLSKLLNLAERWERRPLGTNVCKLIEVAPTGKRTRYVTAEEGPRIAAALEAHRTKTAAVDAIRLLIATGARVGEILAARWDQIDNNVLTLPDSKSGKPRYIFLNAAALEVLHIIWNVRTQSGLGRAWSKIREDAGCPDLHLHDLRHSFASSGVAAGLTLAQIELLLGHSNPATTQRYAHLQTEAGHAAAAAVGEKLRGGKK